MDPRLDVAIRQIESARQYLLVMIQDVDDADWFRMPPGCPSHVAWQVGHLAMAQYGLCLLRIRGKQPEDAQFITNDFMRTFKKSSQPLSDASSYPSPQEIRDCLSEVHQHALSELPHYTTAQLDETLPEPHAAFATKLGSLLFCPAHEMLHAGQIGLIRRMLGKDPVR
jgi:hypothetical protein